MSRSEDAAFWQGVDRALRALGIGLIGLGGLIGAAGPYDPIRATLGLGTFVLAVLGLAVGMKRYYDGRPSVALDDLVIADFDALAIGLPILAVLGIAGLALAAHAGRADLAGFGLGLAGACLVLAFLSLKACYDATGRGSE